MIDVVAAFIEDGCIEEADLYSPKQLSQLH